MIRNQNDFWEKVKRGEAGECWLWQGNTTTGGYGQIYYDGRTWRVHRLAWIFTHSAEIPNGYVICHKCDNPPCCNPNHLFLGTQEENMKDAARKGRCSTRRIRISKPHPNMVTIPDAAQRLGVCNGSVRSYLKKGQLQGRRIGMRQWEISEESILQFEQKQLAAGNQGNLPRA